MRAGDDPARARGSRARGLALNLLILGASSLVALLVLEAGFRVNAVLRKRPMTVGEEPWFEYDPVRGWRHIAGKVVPKAYSAGPVLFDRDGFRIDAADTVAVDTVEPDSAASGSTAPASGPRRRTILAIGDSFTFGHRVLAREAWPARLEERLGRSSNRVINMGACAYGVDQMDLWLREVADRLAPGDLVILGIIAPDLRRALMPRWVSGHGRPLFRVKGDELVLTNVPVPQKLPQGALDGEILLSLRRSELGAFVRERAGFLGPNSARRSVALGARLVEEMRDLAAGRGAGFLLAILPMTANMEKPTDPQGTMDRLAEAVSPKAISVVDCRVGFPSADSSKFFVEDGHPTAAGHEAIAERLCREIETRFPDRAEPDGSADSAGARP